MRHLALVVACLIGCSSPAEQAPAPAPETCPTTRVCGENWSYVPNEAEVTVEPIGETAGDPSQTIPGHESRWRMVNEGNNRFAYVWTVPDCGLQFVCRAPARGMYACTEVARSFTCGT